MNTIPALIGLRGFAGSGKDTVADILGVIQGYERYAFADAVRDVCRTGVSSWFYESRYEPAVR